MLKIYAGSKFPGTGKFKGFEPPFNVLKNHNHAPNYICLSHLKGDKLLVDCVKNSNDKPRDIVNKVYGSYTIEEIAISKSRNALKQKLNLARRRQRVVVPVAKCVEGQPLNEGETFYFEDSPQEGPTV